MSRRRGRWILAVPLAAAGALWFWWLVLPWPVLLAWRDPGRTAFMSMRQAEAHRAGEAYEIRHEWIPLERVPESLQRAVILAEDGEFYNHHGVDWAALAEEFRYQGDDDFSWLDPSDLRALFDSFRYFVANREGIRGRSTITQQVAKNLYFGEDRSVLRKFEEYVVTRRLERFLTKDRILEIYLNIAEFGPGIFGAEAAAQHYFDRSAARLTVTQSASLAATLPHPLTSNPAFRPGRMNWRRDLILQRMRRNGPVGTVPRDSSEP